MIRELADFPAWTNHRLRLLLLSTLFLLVASAMAALSSHFLANWLKFAAAIISLMVLVPLANEVYVRYGTRWMTALGLGSLMLIILLLGVLEHRLDFAAVVPTVQR